MPIWATSTDVCFLHQENCGEFLGRIVQEKHLCIFHGLTGTKPISLFNWGIDHKAIGFEMAGDLI